MDITILSNIELWILWGIALTMPLVAHWSVCVLSRSLGVDAGATLPRVLLLTTASVITLLWLTGSRFSSIEVGHDKIRLKYAMPIKRTTVLDRNEVAGVFLNEERFPQHSYALQIESEDGRRFRSVGVTSTGLAPLYDAFDSFNPGQAPYVALTVSETRSPF